MKATVNVADVKLAAQRIKDLLIDIEAEVFDEPNQAGNALFARLDDISGVVRYIINNVTDCDDCHGTRVINCAHCDGRGWFGYSEWTIESWCEQCNHTGRMPCRRCR